MIFPLADTLLGQINEWMNKSVNKSARTEGAKAFFVCTHDPEVIANNYWVSTLQGQGRK